MKYAYWLHNIPGIGNGKIRMLYQAAKSAEEIYHLSVPHLKKVTGITEEDIKAFQKSQKKWDGTRNGFHLWKKGLVLFVWSSQSFQKK
jgi:DNA processing protein